MRTKSGEEGISAEGIDLTRLGLDCTESEADKEGMYGVDGQAPYSLLLLFHHSPCAPYESIIVMDGLAAFQPDSKRPRVRRWPS